MQISLRSHLIAGTAAVVGAGAVAMTPVVTPELNLSALRTDAVSMMSFDNPIAALLANVGQTVDYLLNADTVASGSGLVNWPFAGIDDTTNAALVAPELGGYVNVGIVPQILSDSFPIITQVVNNQIGYLTLLADLGLAVGGLAAGLAWLPVDLGVSIFNDIITGQFDQILPDITATITAAFDAVVDVFELAIAIPVDIIGSIATRAFAVAQTVFESIPTLVEAVIGQGAAFLAAGQTAVEGIFTAISTGNLENIWNASVAGLLSPEGVPGVINNLTFGAGVGSLPDFVPSTRTLVQASVKAVATAAGTPFVPPRRSRLPPRRPLSRLRLSWLRLSRLRLSRLRLSWLRLSWLRLSRLRLWWPRLSRLRPLSRLRLWWPRLRPLSRLRWLPRRPQPGRPLPRRLRLPRRATRTTPLPPPRRSRPAPTRPRRTTPRSNNPRIAPTRRPSPSGEGRFALSGTAAFQDRGRAVPKLVRRHPAGRTEGAIAIPGQSTDGG